MRNEERESVPGNATPHCCGAGLWQDEATTRSKNTSRTCPKECDALLATGKSAPDVVDIAVAELERSGLYVAGRGSAPNTAGYVELDASIMHGPSREAGADAQVTRYTPGQFLARHSGDITREGRRIAYVMGFSEEWHPDWGGKPRLSLTGWFTA